MNHHDQISCVRLVPIFNHLDQESMDLVGDKAQTQKYPKESFLFQPEDQNDSLYIVHRGKVKIYRLTESGKEQLIRILNPGDFMGEWAILGEKATHDDYAQAMVETQVCRIHRDDMQTLLAHYPAIAMQLMTEMAQRLQQSERQTVKIATEQVGSRIALFLAELGSGQNNEKVKLGMSRKDLASYLGTTPETISRKFRLFEEQGLIETVSSQELTIRDLDGLLLYSE